MLLMPSVETSSSLTSIERFDVLKYPALFSPSLQGGYVVTFRDVPEAITQGDDLESALIMALDALVTSIAFYFQRHKTFPLPSRPIESEIYVNVPLSVELKINLLDQCVLTNKRPIDLARLMEVAPQEITRILDVRHKTKVNTLSAAFNALGLEMELKIKPTKTK